MPDDDDVKDAAELGEGGVEAALELCLGWVGLGWVGGGEGGGEEEEEDVGRR